jgi:hypothetical protein
MLHTCGLAAGCVAMPQQLCTALLLQHAAWTCTLFQLDLDMAAPCHCCTGMCLRCCAKCEIAAVPVNALCTLQFSFNLQ